MGGIGRNLASKAAALGMTVTYHNRRRLPPADEGGARYVDFETLLARSDVVSLNLPLNESTRGMIGKTEFAKMKKGAVVVNTARGGVVNEAALVESVYPLFPPSSSPFAFSWGRTRLALCMYVYTNILFSTHSALNTSQISSCGLDVYENEPEVHPGLVANPKVMLLPHMGTWTVETQTEMELWTIANVRSALENGKLTSPVAEQEGMI